MPVDNKGWVPDTAARFREKGTAQATGTICVQSRENARTGCAGESIGPTAARAGQNPEATPQALTARRTRVGASFGTSTSTSRVETDLPALHLHLHLVGLDRTCLAMTARISSRSIAMRSGCPDHGAFMGQQDLQPFPRDGRGALAGEELEQVHAALLPNSFPKRPFWSLGMIISTASPFSRRAASV